MQPNQLTYLAAQGQQTAGDDQLDRQRLVADRVEKNRHLIAVVALYRAFPPIRVLHARTDRERAICCCCLALSRIAVVAVAARTLVLLAEVAEDELATAPGMLGIGAHHLYAGAIEGVALLLCLRCALHGVLELLTVAARSDLTSRERIERPGLREAGHGGGELGLRQLKLVAEQRGLDRLSLFEDGLGNALDHIYAKRAAGEESP